MRRTTEGELLQEDSIEGRSPGSQASFRSQTRMEKRQPEVQPKKVTPGAGCHQRQKAIQLEQKETQAWRQRDSPPFPLMRQHQAPETARPGWANPAPGEQMNSTSYSRAVKALMVELLQHCPKAKRDSAGLRKNCWKRES